MNHLAWRLRRLMHVAGLPGAVASMLALALLAHHLLVALPDGQRMTALQRDVEDLQARARPGSDPRQLRLADEQLDLQAFEARFPDERRLTTILARVTVLAARSGVAIERAEFKFERRSGDLLNRYVMQLPLQADYRALRRFLRDLLREQRAIALDEVTVRREDSKQSTVQAQVRLVLYLAQGSPS